MKSIGILHPGEMGISVAVTAKNSGCCVYWCSQNRSIQTRNRADSLGLKDLNTLEELCRTCEVLVSVCPPHAAIEQADAVIAAGFTGLYADINAIAPATSRELNRRLSDAGITFVDGGIIGLPATVAGTTWLYLSGPDAEQIAKCFSKGPMEAVILGSEIGQASGLKMCFAANSKGTAAMQSAILATAESMGVRDALEKQWDIYTPGFTEKSHARIRQVASKSWRFTGEMHEIAATLAASGLPPEFHQGAADIYSRQESFKNVTSEPSLEEILNKLLEKSPDKHSEQ